MNARSATDFQGKTRIASYLILDLYSISIALDDKSLRIIINLRDMVNSVKTKIKYSREPLFHVNIMCKKIDKFS